MDPVSLGIWNIACIGFMSKYFNEKFRYIFYTCCIIMFNIWCNYVRLSKAMALK